MDGKKRRINHISSIKTRYNLQEQRRGKEKKWQAKKCSFRADNKFHDFRVFNKFVLRQWSRSREPPGKRMEIVCSCEYIHSISPQLDRQRKCQLFTSPLASTFLCSGPGSLLLVGFLPEKGKLRSKNSPTHYLNFVLCRPAVALCRRACLPTLLESVIFY